MIAPYIVACDAARISNARVVALDVLIWSTLLESLEADIRTRGDDRCGSDARREYFHNIEPTEEVELVLDPERFPVERYKPLQELGRGASRAVFLCRDRMLGEKVAVKTLRQLSAEQLIAFQFEARANSKLNHPAIITLLDFGPTPAGAPYMVLAYFKSVTLEDFLRVHGKVPLPIFKQIFEPIISGLAHAHSKGIFHRDLKPSNILIDTLSLQVKLIDFGVARIKEDTQSIELIDRSNSSVRSGPGSPARLQREMKVK